ncbi:MAG: hypothetical protein ACRD0K_19075 [Egibacteraceae bacterium]
MDKQWYWCMKHGRAEQGPGCPADQRLGPYPSQEAARDWQRTADQRNRAWEEDDARWEGGEGG